jgi:hypothetical protein
MSTLTYTDCLTRLSTHLLSPRLLLILMTLVDQEMIRENIKRYPAEVHLEQARRLVSAIACEPLVAPGDPLARDRVRLVRTLICRHLIHLLRPAGRRRKVARVVGAVVARRPGRMEHCELGM